MALIFEPPSPWYIISTGAALGIVTAVICRFFFDRWRSLGYGIRTRVAVLFLSVTAALLFAIAAMNPILMRKPVHRTRHLSVVLDVSDSVLHAEEGWPGILALAHKRLAAGIEALSGNSAGTNTASILTVRTEVVTAKHRISLFDLPNAFNRISERDFPAGRGSDISAGLAKAARITEQAGGAVVLISDGHQTRGDALAAATRLARLGIPVHVFPVKSKGPGISITAADLPRQADGNAETFIRGLIMNSTDTGEETRLMVKLNPGLDGNPGRFGTSAISKTVYSIPGKAWARIHRSLKFQGHGLQFVDLSLFMKDTQEVQNRRFFIHVRRPPRILAVGENNRWTGAVPRDSADIIHSRPENLSPGFNFTSFDAIVISSVAANRFHPGILADIAESVTKDGVGLMLINGSHYGASDESKTILMSYNDTPIDPLVPVSSKPRPFKAEPPSRQVVMLIDASSSMAGRPLAKSKEIATHIVRNLLRPQDYLDLIAFTSSALHLVSKQQMDNSGKQYAISRINSIAASGGTDPSHALALVAGRKMEHCGLIFISDGEFARVAYRPDCRATVFAIGHNSVSANSPLWELADPFPVNNSFDPSRITIPYFEPEQRKKFFEPGRFTPLSMKYLLSKKDQLLIPDLQLNGSAVTYIRPDAVMIAVRPKLTDPVLAYKESGVGYTGVFTTGFPNKWIENDQGRRAVYDWISRVIPYTARDRYDFQLTDTGDIIEIQISLAPRNYKIPETDHLSVDIKVGQEAPVGVPMRIDPDSPGTFRGHIRIPRTSHTRKGVLILRESGPGALARPQRIPMLIPYALPVKNTLPAESFSYGMNEPLLRALAMAGGGTFDPPLGMPFFRERSVQNKGTPLWPYLAIASVVFYITAIALQRWDP
ncbi:MAG: VWA domain-containing protein [Desulfobacteraceae bacterium]|nr:VWA domain-containing protein [Desulfobacteraceae bacterium]